MAKLISAAIASLDGYTEDAGGAFDWAAPSAEVHAFVNDLERPIGTYLYGRRMYETMVYWATVPTSGAADDASDDAIHQDYARIWQAADKVVYSTTLETPTTERTRVERTFDPDAVRQLKASAAHDISIGGPALAAEALRAGLVDELHLLLSPVVIGGGKAALPDGVRLALELLDERRFADGTVHLHYRVGS
jgi:dihydrofolate reductase